MNRISIIILQLTVLLSIQLARSSYFNDNNDYKSSDNSIQGSSIEEEFNAEKRNKFPKKFIFGAASASYQVEGAWNEDGKGENLWDQCLHNRPYLVRDFSNGDVACDSYHKYKEDVQLLKNVGFNYYRFSLSWSRILPTGDDNNVNEEGVKYYKNLIDELLANGIKPMVTLYHWDLPQRLQDIGGWANPLIADYFERYCRIAFERFGDKVKTWITLNEPIQVAKGYGSGTKCPAIGNEGIGEYLAAHTLLRAHAKAYHLYDKHFRSLQHGEIGITICSYFYFPLKDTDDDKKAAEDMIQFELGWFAHPIFSRKGDYPTVMRRFIDANSKSEGRSVSRLPKFTKKEIKELKGSADFFGLNHYSSYLVTKGETGNIPSVDRDSGGIKSTDPSWPGSASEWLKVVPKGFGRLLNWMKAEYHNPPIIVTEIGFSENGTTLEDNNRIDYFKGYLKELLTAIHKNKCNVKGLTVWSLMDNFEWFKGYTEKFGLYHVDFKDNHRKRTPKKSVKFFQRLLKSRKIPNDL